ncbi:MAG: hypothetical protein AB7I41_22385 [Candidatus Sericytochromatia bacterium]
MRILLLAVQNRPESVDLPSSELSSFPGVLREEPISTQHKLVKDLPTAAQEIRAYQPDLVVFRGEPGVTLFWQNQLEKAFPRLFSFVSEQAEIFAILAELNPRLWALRRKRLQDKCAPYRPTEKVDTHSLFQTFETTHRKQAEEKLHDWLHLHPRLLPFLNQVESADFERILYCMALLEEALRDWKCPASVRALDVGTHAWNYAPALAVSLREKASLVELTGIELDPWYLHQNCTRGDLARYYAQICQARFLEGDFLQFRERQDLICHFLPLILPQNALLWRIPLQYHHPVQWLKHTWDRLRPGGRAVFYIGKEVEYKAFLQTVKNAGLELSYSAPWFCPWRQKEQGFLNLLGRAK